MSVGHVVLLFEEFNLLILFFLDWWIDVHTLVKVGVLHVWVVVILVNLVAFLSKEDPKRRTVVLFHLLFANYLLVLLKGFFIFLITAKHWATTRLKPFGFSLLHRFCRNIFYRPFDQRFKLGICQPSVHFIKDTMNKTLFINLFLCQIRIKLINLTKQFILFQFHHILFTSHYLIRIWVKHEGKLLVLHRHEFVPFVVDLEWCILDYVHNCGKFVLF